MESRSEGTLKQNDRPVYVTPTVATLNEAEVLDEVGPAQAYTGSFPFGF
jgi:hypothetical protein